MIELLPVEWTARAFPALRESKRRLQVCLVAFSSREPVSTSLENALVKLIPASFEPDRADVSDCRMTSGRIVEAFDAIEHIRLGLVPDAIVFTWCALVFSDEKKLSIAALSQTFPDLLMLQTMPLSPTGAELLFEVFSQHYERGSTG